MEITPAQLERYRRSARQREADRLEKLAARRERAWEQSCSSRNLGRGEWCCLARLTIRNCNLRDRISIWQFGISSIPTDLLDPDPEIGFDLVPVEDARPAILEIIAKKGIDL